MIIGISGHKQSGKNTVALIWQLLVFEASPRYKEIVRTRYATDIEYVTACIKGEEEWAPYGHYFTWKQKSFAYKLKQVVCTLTGCTMEQLEKEEFKNSDVPYTWTKSALEISTYRELMQKLGTEVFRKTVHERIWIDLLMSQYDKAVMDGKPEDWLITDVRFKDEADSVNGRSGTLIRVHKNTDIKENHQSELDLDDYPWFQYELDNNGTIEELVVQVRDVMRKEGIL